jgi:hypothetical protein
MSRAEFVAKLIAENGAGMIKLYVSASVKRQSVSDGR